MYVKLSFKFDSWEVPQCAGGYLAILRKKPEIVSTLPEGATANKHSKQLKTFITQKPVQGTYFHDCKELTEEQINKGLDEYAKHYNNYLPCPGTLLFTPKSHDNEMIKNLEIVLQNQRNQTNLPLHEELSTSNLQECLSLALG